MVLFITFLDIANVSFSNHLNSMWSAGTIKYCYSSKWSHPNFILPRAQAPFATNFWYWFDFFYFFVLFSFFYLFCKKQGAWMSLLGQGVQDQKMVNHFRVILIDPMEYLWMRRLPLVSLLIRITTGSEPSNAFN